MRKTVGAALIRDGQVLLGLRAAHKSFAGAWDLIGGHIENGETPWTALCRELTEELGVACIAGQYLEALEIDQPGRPSTLHIYSVSSWQGEPTVRNDEHSEIRWFQLDVAKQMPNLATPQYRPIFASLLERSLQAKGS